MGYCLLQKHSCNYCIDHNQKSADLKPYSIWHVIPERIPLWSLLLLIMHVHVHVSHIRENPSIEPLVINYACTCTSVHGSHTRTRENPSIEPLVIDYICTCTWQLYMYKTVCHFQDNFFWEPVNNDYIDGSKDKEINM